MPKALTLVAVPYVTYLGGQRVVQELKVVIFTFDDVRQRRRRRRTVFDVVAAAELLDLQPVGDGVAILGHFVGELDVELRLEMEVIKEFFSNYISFLVPSF